LIDELTQVDDRGRAQVGRRLGFAVRAFGRRNDAPGYVRDP
jgi:hypothetical protein